MELKVNETTNLIYRFAEDGSLFPDLMERLAALDLNNPDGQSAVDALDHASELSGRLHEIPNIDLSREIGVVIVGLNRKKRVILTPSGAEKWRDSKFKASKNGIGWVENAAGEITVGTLLDHQKIDYLPVQTHIKESMLSGAVAHLVLIQEFVISERVKLALIDLYGLTGAELRLCENLFLGRTLNEISVLTDVKRETLKSHVSKVFAKTGLNRQSDLIRMLTQLSAVVSVNDYGKTHKPDAPKGLKPGSLSIDTQILETRYRKKISYSLYGDLKGKPVIYFHSSMGSRSHSHEMAAAAKKSNLMVIKFDRPGFGHSEPVNGYSPQVLANCVKDLMDHLDVKQADFFGQSMGSRDVLEIAPLLGDRLGKVLLYSPRLHSVNSKRSIFSLLVGMTSVNFVVFLRVLRILYSTINTKVIESNFRRTFKNSPTDLEATNNPLVMSFILSHMKLSGRQNLLGTEREYKAIATQFNFNPNDYNDIDISAFYGGHDSVNGPQDSEEIFSQMKRARIFICKNEGMLLPYYDHGKLLRYAYQRPEPEVSIYAR